jgi:hypothetical protein
MDESLLVNPFGSFHAKLLVFSSYPTKAPRSTVHMRYSTVDDLSNLCMSTLYNKLGFGQVNLRESDMFHVDVFPHRLGRLEMGCGSRCDSVVTQVPPVLRHYWENAAIDAIALSKSGVVLNMGRYAATVYQHSLKKRGVHYTEISLGSPVIRQGSPVNRQLPIGWFEYALSLDGSLSLQSSSRRSAPTSERSSMILTLIRQLMTVLTLSFWRGSRSSAPTAASKC